ncbi:MAG: type II toxin-antitoxin system VapC family toxin [Janthinobacterium lividum]
MTIVVDASIAAAWLLPDEGNEAADRVLDQLKASYGIAPSVFRHEVRNILVLAERRKRLGPTETSDLLVELEGLPVLDSGPGDDAEVILLARTYKLTAYDAAYLSLALRAAVPLATLDRALAAAAHTSGVAILGPLAS